VEVVVEAVVQEVVHQIVPVRQQPLQRFLHFRYSINSYKTVASGAEGANLGAEKAIDKNTSTRGRVHLMISKDLFRFWYPEKYFESDDQLGKCIW